jgi:hypothetical protein
MPQNAMARKSVGPGVGRAPSKSGHVRASAAAANQMPKHAMVGPQASMGLDMFGMNRASAYAARQMSNQTSAASPHASFVPNTEHPNEGLDDGFQYQKKKRRNRKQEFVQGNQEPENGGLVGGPDYVDMFISRVNKKCNENDVKEYITGKNVKVDSVVLRSNQDKADLPTKSFVAKVSSADWEKLMSPDFWVSGVRCRKYIHYREKKNENHNQ